jgi:hypothetical protein
MHCTSSHNLSILINITHFFRIPNNFNHRLIIKSTKLQCMDVILEKVKNILGHLGPGLYFAFFFNPAPLIIKTAAVLYLKSIKL